MSMLDMLRMREVVDEVVTFANAAAEASQLPGGQFGPRDAFRHIVGSAELTRRLGFWPARAVTELNETRSWVFEQLRTNLGEHAAPSLRADSRIMDRANNAIGQGIGLNAASPDAILEAARQQIERAWQLGAGTGGGADWLPPARWTEPNLGTEEGQNWPPANGPISPPTRGSAPIPDMPSGQTAVAFQPMIKPQAARSMSARTCAKATPSAAIPEPCPGINPRFSDFAAHNPLPSRRPLNI